MLTDIALAFLMGAIICATVQVFIDKTALTPARVLVGLVVTGVLLFGIGAYEPLFDIFGAGISVPLLGFGATIARGVREAVMKDGPIGILTGGLTASAAGITLALLLGLSFSLIGHGKRRSIPKAHK